MSWSMNEVEVLAKKAARGAGQSWGLAEETGKAVRMLAGQGIEATGHLATLLKANDGVAFHTIAPADPDGVWSASGGQLCPLVAGACLSDRAAEFGVDRDLTLDHIAFPVFLIPFAQAVARQTGRTIRLNWADVYVFVDGALVWVDGNVQSLSISVVVSAEVSAVDNTTGRALDKTDRAAMTQIAAAELTGFAQRTYAPATDASRLAGAGAGLSDND